MLRRCRNFDIVRLAEQGRLVYGVAAAAVRLSVHYLRVEGGGLGQGSGPWHDRRALRRGVAMGCDRAHRLFWRA